MQMPNLIHIFGRRNRMSRDTAQEYKPFIFANRTLSVRMRPAILMCKPLRKGERNARLIKGKLFD
jgi:hypothetical protein